MAFFSALARNRELLEKDKEIQSLNDQLSAKDERIRKLESANWQLQGEIRPIDTLHERGIVHKRADGYPAGVTSWDRLEAGEEAPAPAQQPSEDDED